MDSYIDALLTKRTEAANRMREIVSGAEAEARELTAEEQDNLKSFDADYDKYEKEWRDLGAYKEKVAASDAFREAVAPQIETARIERRDPTDMEMFLRGFESVKSGSGYAFDARMSSDFQTRALQSAGGSAVPTSFADFVTVFERTFTPMLEPSVVTILNRSNGAPLVLPRVTADPNHGGTVTAEAGGINELDATISSVTLTPFKYGITNLWSAELADDNTIGLEELLARTTGRELGLDIGTHLTTGTDTTQPNGLITAAANGGTASGTANNTFFGPADIVDLFYGRAAPYRQIGAWMASSTGLGKIRKLADSNGQFIWQPSLIVGQPETVLGRPIYENPAMAAVASASKSVAFGDLSRYIVSRVTPIRVEMSKDYKFNTDQLALRTIERVDGDLVDTISVAFLVSANL